METWNRLTATRGAEGEGNSEKKGERSVEEHGQMICRHRQGFGD